MNLKSCVFALAVAFSAPALAVQQSYASPKDSRIRYVDYDAQDIVVVLGRVGTSTMVVFDQDEKILDMSGGDTAAWAVGTTTARNSFFLKPSAVSPATNLHVVTTKRTYSIDLKLAGRGQVNYLSVLYRYPTQDAAKQQAVTEARRTREALTAGAPSARKNFKYSMQGASDIAPVEAFDDGTATYLRFAPNSTVPAAYVVAEDGKEHLVNVSMQNDMLRVQKVGAKLILRSGDLVTCIFNDAYNAIGTRTDTGTASPEVQRVIKGRQK
jgi:type IV secretion system protein VirB9